MDPNQVLETINESGIAGPQFWYIYALVVTSLLVLLIIAIITLIRGFLTKFLADIKDTNAKFAESIEKLTQSNTKLDVLVRLHDEQIKDLQDDVKDISKRRTR